MIKIASITIVLLGLISLIAAIVPAYKICRADNNKGWRFLLALISIFVIAYSAFFFVLLFSQPSLIELGLSAILFGGGIFVIVVIKLSLQSIQKVMEDAQLKYYEARHDILTELPNRLHFMECLEASIAKAKQANSAFSILMLDLDRFKEINDTLGHALGDKLLRELAKRLNSYVQDNVFVARLGGDEFAWVLDNTSEADAIEHAQHLLEAVKDVFCIDDYLLTVEMSVGIALYPQHGDNQEELLKGADIAMYLAKKRKEHYVLYNEQQNTHSLKRLGLLTSVRQAVENGEFELHYQPIFDAKSSELRGFEALIRWQQHDGTFISPVEFIPQIEQSRVMCEVSRWVIQTAMQQLKSWQHLKGSCVISINLSAYDMQDSELVSFIENSLKEFDLPANSLCFEITESAVMIDKVRAQKIVNEIVELGAMVALDDFGTGFSSLSLLKDLSAHVVKIDRSFVSNITCNADDEAIVRSVVELSHRLGREVVAEGLEDEASMLLLTAMGCDFLQGFYLSKPLNCNSAEKLLRNITTLTEQAR